MAGLIGEIAEIVPTVHANTSNRQINELFKQDMKHSGIVVVEKDVPIGLVTRTNFYQKLGSLYGYNLYIGKSIGLLMNTHILTVDYTTSIIEVSKLAMQREEEELYDYVIITKNELFAGVVSISRLLLKFAEIQTEIASYLNPLTGLPGNLLIDEKLNELLGKEAFTVLYIDMDYFKTYNDVYGFTKGDQVIKATAALLQNILKETKGFLGHIGGDDFLAILHHYDYEKCCNSMIQEFDQLLPTFYSQEHFEQKFVISEDRSGVVRKIPLLSLSISVVTNQGRAFFQKDEIVHQATEIKKLCKHTPGSCYLDSNHTFPPIPK